MQKAFFLVVAAGAAFGLFWPSGERAAPVRAAAAVAPGEVRETVLQRSEGGHFYVHAEVNGELVRFLVDTGASGVALTEADARRVGLKFSPKAYTEVGMGAGGPVHGAFVTIDKVVVDGKEARGLRGAVIQGADMNLLGQEYLGRFSVEMRGDTMRIY